MLLIAISLLGAFDIAYFHRKVAELHTRRESRLETKIHVARGFVYALRLLVVATVRLEGAWYAAFVALYVADVAIAWADVWIEPDSRRSQGGLPRGEYFMHVVLSVLVGADLFALGSATHHWLDRPAAIAFAPNVSPVLHTVLFVLGAGCLLNTLYELLEIIASARPKPLHIRRRLRVDLETLWRYTQDHVAHPDWDRRFSRIVMLADEIRTGTEMRYEKRILGITIRGFGRYELHRPMKQSTFEIRLGARCTRCAIGSERLLIVRIQDVDPDVQRHRRRRSRDRVSVRDRHLRSSVIGRPSGSRSTDAPRIPSDSSARCAATRPAHHSDRRLSVVRLSYRRRFSRVSSFVDRITAWHARGAAKRTHRTTVLSTVLARVRRECSRTTGEYRVQDDVQIQVRRVPNSVRQRLAFEYARGANQRTRQHRRQVLLGSFGRRFSVGHEYEDPHHRKRYRILPLSPGRDVVVVEPPPNSRLVVERGCTGDTLEAPIVRSQGGVDPLVGGRL
jgi:hypothetical protein